MNIDDPVVLSILRRSMVARIATLSRNGRPSINPLYFIPHSGHIWLGTSTWTLAARNVVADARVSVLFEVEQDQSAHRVLRIRGQARVRTERRIQHSYSLRVVWKYLLTPGGIYNMISHWKLLPLMHAYHAQSARMGQSCIIEVIPLEAEFLNDGKHS